jgi:hypothetical protein
MVAPLPDPPACGPNPVSVPPARLKTNRLRESTNSCGLSSHVAAKRKETSQAEPPELIGLDNRPGCGSVFEVVGGLLVVVSCSTCAVRTLQRVCGDAWRIALLPRTLE